MTKDVLETNQLCSFRDPSARVVVTSGRVLRVATGPEGQSIKEFLESRLAEALEAEGKLVHTRLCDRADAGSLVWEHERVPFPSYPYEWPPEMLHSAAELTVELARRALPEGYGLKDATPCNVLFRGPRPVFVDVASFERRDLRDPVWLAYAQFVRTFLLPLAADKYLGITPADVFINHRDGLSPEAVHAMLPAARKLHPFFLEWVTLPALISRTGAARSGGIYRPRRSTDSEQARFTLEVHLKRFERALRRVAPDSGRKSAWSDYPATAAHYD